MAQRHFSTSRFGELALDEERLLQFLKPILGFEHVREYALIEHGENTPFFWLQAVTDPDLAFVVTNPTMFGIDYAFTVPEDVAELLSIREPDDVTVLNIVTIPNDQPQRITANLMAPIVFNHYTRQALQYVLQDSTYTTKVPLLPALPEASSSPVTKQEG